MRDSTKLIIFVSVVVLAGLPLLGQLANTSAPTPSPPQSISIPQAPQHPNPPPPPSRPPVQTAPRNTSGVIENAHRNHAGNLPVAEQGVVSRILPDDNEGSRHQRFIVTLASGHTVLVAHNIDIAPRINALREGDPIAFSGIYEWNEKGGTVHWTHHDPSGRHAAGHLEHNGRTYQ